LECNWERYWDWESNLESNLESNWESKGHDHNLTEAEAEPEPEPEPGAELLRVASPLFLASILAVPYCASVLALSVARVPVVDAQKVPYYGYVLRRRR